MLNRLHSVFDSIKFLITHEKVVCRQLKLSISLAEEVLHHSMSVDDRLFTVFITEPSKTKWKWYRPPYLERERGKERGREGEGQGKRGRGHFTCPLLLLLHFPLSPRHPFLAPLSLLFPRPSSCFFFYPSPPLLINNVSCPLPSSSIFPLPSSPSSPPLYSSPSFLFTSSPCYSLLNPHPLSLYTSSSLFLAPYWATLFLYSSPSSFLVSVPHLSYSPYHPSLSLPPSYTLSLAPFPLLFLAPPPPTFLADCTKQHLLSDL